MRHNKKFNHLGRQRAHRELMLSNMACSLIMHKRITTTVAKAKALRIYVEPIITRSKSDTTHARRVAFADLRDKHAVKELFREVAPRIAERPGGYTRIVRTGTRLGDNAEVCIMELVDFNLGYNQGKAATTKKTTRRSRRSSTKKVEAPAAPAAETKPSEEETK
ncbi:MAG: 50S ribosomal protein L17 [Bacteroidia bacterium]|nr:MAG: 50S ribosomal protein L17 [Bacteroidia bacterium]